MINASVEEIEPGKVVKYRLFLKNRPLSYRYVIDALNSNTGFRESLNDLLAEAPFASYRFETPALALHTIDKPFEFVLIDAPNLQQRSVDPYPFEQYFTSGGSSHNSPGGAITKTFETDSEPATEEAASMAAREAAGNVAAEAGVVKFKSLGGDATLIVPSPQTDHNTYNHIASFVRAAPKMQIDALWLVVGQELQSLVGTSPLWLNTEGSGVAWLHVRIDTRPKYYGHREYTAAAGFNGG